MIHPLAIGVALLGAPAEPPPPPLPRVVPGWSVELVARAPDVLFPTAIAQGPDGRLFVGQDPMDMPGPPTRPIDSVVAIDPRTGARSTFADGLWAVMGLEWVDDALIVVHAPFLSALRDRDGDGRAEDRVDLVAGLGPPIPGFNGINDHVASGVRLGLDGFLYVSIGDKGIPRGVGRDGSTVRMKGGGVIRVRPDGSGLEVVSTGERNPLSTMLSGADDVFTYGNDDDSKKWPNSLTHHVVGGHYGYPYEFLNRPDRRLPIVAGEVGGSGTQGVCLGGDGLPRSMIGDLLICDWGLRRVDRVALEPAGASFRQASRQPVVSGGELADFRPFGACESIEPGAIYLTDWAFNGWLADGPRTGRVYRLKYAAADAPAPAAPPRLDTPAARIDALAHPSLSTRLRAQRAIIRGRDPAGPIAATIARSTPGPTRLHAIWALDGLGGPVAEAALRGALDDPDPAVRCQAARRAGIRRDGAAREALERRLIDPDDATRREAAIALGRIGDDGSTPALMAALGDDDPVVAWSVRRALKAIDAWDRRGLTAAILDPARSDSALRLADESYAPAVVGALVDALGPADARTRARIATDLIGLYRREPEWSGRWFGTNPLAGRFPEKTVDWDGAAMEAIADALTRALADEDRDVRGLALIGLANHVGAPSAPAILARLPAEPDPDLARLMVAALGGLRARGASAPIARIALDPARPGPARVGAIEALAEIADRAAASAVSALLFDPKSPPALVVAALGGADRLRSIPSNDLAEFAGHADPGVRARALGILAARRPIPAPARALILDHLSDPSAAVRSAAARAAGAGPIREAVPGLIRLAGADETRGEAIEALAAMPDPRAAGVFLDALGDPSPDRRRLSERALGRVRDEARPALDAAARSGSMAGPAAEALSRVLTRSRPVVDWRVIGPFPRTTAQLFIGDPAIDFGRHQVGAEGRDLAWQARRGDAADGRVGLDDLKAGAGDRGGFGYDATGSPDLAAFAAAEWPSDRDRDAYLRVGSSGGVVVTLNEAVVANVADAGRPFDPDSTRVRVRLRAGSNRLLVRTRQGVGRWAFGVQLSDEVAEVASRKAPATPEELRAFAAANEGDRGRGEALFFDPKGLHCDRCHSAGGRGDAKVGPDLTGLAAKYDRADVIRSILEPSARIATGYQPVVAALADGRVVVGLAREETASTLSLVLEDGRLATLPVAEIESRRLGDASIMPAGLVDGLEPAAFADLVTYLMGLKGPAPAAPPR